VTTPRKQKPRKRAPRRKRGPQLRPDVAAAIERAWPDGVIEMIDPEDSWFAKVHPKLVKAFQRIKGARLVTERPENIPLLPYWDDDDDEHLYEYEGEEFPLSYHLFFVSPEGEPFTFETESETTADPEYNDETGELEFDELNTITVAGRGHIGWSVAVSLIAPVAVIALSEYSVYEDGTASEPTLGGVGQDENGQPIDPETHFRQVHGEEPFRVLEKLRSNIEAILKKRAVLLLPEEELGKEVPWLRGGEDAFAEGVGQQPVRVLNAFFFVGL
jgi:hypothetical protein